MAIDALQIAFVLLYAYLVGSVPLAYILGRRLRGIDIRLYGSGNVGASNVWVHVGKWAIVPMGLFDMLVKGASPIWIARYGFGLGSEVQAAAGLLAVAGHSWSLYLGFSGGRGIAPAIGVLYSIAPLSPIELGGFILVGLGGWLINRNSALWVGFSILLLPLWAFLAERTVGRDPVFIGLMGALVVMMATKRILSNRGGDVPLRAIWLRRLLHDRDDVSRDEWVKRAPRENSQRK